MPYDDDPNFAPLMQLIAAGVVETPEERIRADAARNVLSPHIRENWERYKRIWDEESQKAGENEKMFQMSPNQLRERGVR